MRWVVLLVTTACGRLGFDATAAAPADAPVDVVVPVGNRLVHFDMEDDPADGEVRAASGHVASCAPMECPTSVPGRPGGGNALRFDGASDVLRVPHDRAFALPGGFTISAWLLMDDASPDQVALAKPVGSGTKDSWSFVAWATGPTCFETTIAGEVSVEACRPEIPPEGRWFHFAGTWDGSERRLYLDGVKQALLSDATPVLFDTHELLLGADENNGIIDTHWHGQLDDVMLFDRALDAAEIAVLAAP